MRGKSGAGSLNYYEIDQGRIYKECNRSGASTTRACKAARPTLPPTLRQRPLAASRASSRTLITSPSGPHTADTCRQRKGRDGDVTGT